jgi:hypothetical protein
MKHFATIFTAVSFLSTYNRRFSSEFNIEGGDIGGAAGFQ